MNRLGVITMAAVAVGLFSNCPAAEAKALYARSFLNRQAPTLQVEKWLTSPPSTDGKFVLLDFWATWCPPCRAAVPELNGYQLEFADNLTVIGISDEPEEAVRRLTNPQPRYALAIDTAGRTKQQVGVTGIPHVMLLDPSGTVRWEGFPFEPGHELTSSVIRNIIARYGLRGGSRSVAGEGRATLRAAYARYFEGLKNNDPEALISLETPDFRRRLTSGKTLRRPAADALQRQTAQNIRAVSNVHFHFGPVQVKGNVATLTATRTVGMWTRDPGGDAHEEVRNLVSRDTWVRANGLWKLRRSVDIAQTITAPPAPSEADWELLN